MIENQSNEQDGKIPTREKSSLFIGTSLYLLCATFGLILIGDVLNGKEIYFSTWFQIIVTGGGAAALLLRFYDDPKIKNVKYFNLTLNISAIIYFAVSIVGFFAIYLITHPDFAPTLGFQIGEIPRTNIKHLWGCVILYAFSAFSILTLPDIWQRVITKIKDAIMKAWKSWGE